MSPWDAAYMSVVLQSSKNGSGMYLQCMDNIVNGAPQMPAEDAGATTARSMHPAYLFGMHVQTADSVNMPGAEARTHVHQGPDKAAICAAFDRSMLSRSP